MTAWEPGDLNQLLLTVSLHLCSFYPLYPPQEDMAIDYENFYAHAQLPVTPDVLIIPSELRYFVKVSLNSAFSHRTESLRLSLLDHRPPLFKVQLTGTVASSLWVVGIENKSVSKTLK